MKYRSLFSPYTLLRQRLDAIAAGEIDPAPGSSNSAILEETMGALASGAPMPKDRYGGGLVPKVEEAFRELFVVRDAGGFEKSQREAA